MSKPLVIAIAALLFTSVCTSVYGESGSPGPDEWKFVVTPYFWAAGMDGNVTVKGFESSVDLSFSDIWDHLDFGAMAHIEARKGKWGVFFDPAYMKLSADGDVGPFDTDVDVELAIIELGALYRLYERPSGSGVAHMISLDILGGVRYWYLKGELDIEGAGPLGIDVEVDKSKDWVDPIVGGRITADLTEKLAFRIRGDIGGFDIGSGSDMTWNIIAGFGYSLSERTTLWLGYRILHVDYDDGSGSDLFEYDVDMSGPIAGLAVRF